METKSVELSIVIPCFNEAKNLPIILEKFSTIVDSDKIEVIIVNNGSTDETDQVLDKLLPKYRFARVYKIKNNQGYGFGISSGLNFANGTFLAYTHADLQTDPLDLIKAYHLMLDSKNPENLFVKGNRIGRFWGDRIFTIGMSIFESLLLKVKLWDINAQPNLFHRKFYTSLTNTPLDFSFDLYILFMAHKMNLEIKRFDVFFPPRLHGESSWNKGIKSKWKFIKRTILFSYSLKKMI